LFVVTKYNNLFELQRLLKKKNFTDKSTKEKKKMKIFFNKKYTLFLLGHLISLEDRPEFTYASFHYCLYFFDFLGQVMHFCKFLCATMVDTYFKHCKNIHPL
jgi:hypothetical protein